MPKELNASAKDTLLAIIKYIKEHQCSPTIRDIADARSIGMSTVSRHLRSLHDAGCIQFGHKSYRGLRVLKTTNGTPLKLVFVKDAIGAR